MEDRFIIMSSSDAKLQKSSYTQVRLGSLATKCLYEILVIVFPQLNKSVGCSINSQGQWLKEIIINFVQIAK